jgi:hypothetical protein
MPHISEGRYMRRKGRAPLSAQLDGALPGHYAPFVGVHARLHLFSNPLPAQAEVSTCVLPRPLAFAPIDGTIQGTLPWLDALALPRCKPAATA